MMSDFDKSLKNKKHVGGGRAQRGVLGEEAHLNVFQSPHHMPCGFFFL